MYNVQEYMAIKKMQANAKKAKELVVPIIEPGLIKLLDKKCKIHHE